MNNEIDWEKEMAMADETMKKADAISKQIEEERKNPENYDTEKVMRAFENHLKENGKTAVVITGLKNNKGNK